MQLRLRLKERLFFLVFFLHLILLPSCKLISVCVFLILKAGYVASVRVVAAGGRMGRWAARLRGGTRGGMCRCLLTTSTIWRLHFVQLVLHSHL